MEYVILAFVSILIILVLINILLCLKKTRNESGFTRLQMEVLNELLSKINGYGKENITSESKILERVINSSNKNIIDSFSASSDSLIKIVSGMSDGQKTSLFNLENKMTINLENIREQINKSMGEVRADSSRQSREIGDTLDKRLAQIEKNVNDNLTGLRSENEIKLNQMRETVDEKLSSTLNTRLTESFNVISTQLELVNKSLGEMQSLTTGVNTLNKVLSNVKTLGTWGEVSLENLLDQILTPDQFARQVLIRGLEKVDVAIIMPGNKNTKVLLPIDSKVPIADYERLLEASENCDKIGVDNAKKALNKTITDMAKSIQSKYIDVPKTTDFAIMYIPIEGLFAEAVRENGLSSKLQNEYRVIMCGPTTLAALLNSLQIGFRTLAIQEKSSEVWSLLSGFKKQFNTFNELLKKTQVKAQQVADDIEKGVKSTAQIEKKLNKLGENNFEKIVAPKEIIDTIDIEVASEE